MTDSTLSFQSAATLAKAVQDRRVGCLELFDQCAARIERLDARVNAVVVRDLGRGREQARRLDQVRTPMGPLHGVPFTVKESFQVAGLPTTWGLPELRDNIAVHDAAAVMRLRQAGAVLLGKTNVPPGLADWQANNALYGRTVNPWNPEYAPGGSSGGAAAALAAGLSPLDVGSDLFGSIRQPSHACGVFGHKPSWGLCSPSGHSPGLNAAMTDISCIGPMARSVDDLLLAFKLLAMPDLLDGAAVMLPPARTAGFAGLRVAVWAEQPGQVTARAITEALLGLAAFLRREGAEVDIAARPGFDAGDAFRLNLQLVAAAAGARLSEADQALRRDRLAALAPGDDGADAVLLRAGDPTHREWLALHEARHRNRRDWARFFQRWDVLVCPVIGAPALPHQAGDAFGRKVAVDGVDTEYARLRFWPGLAGAALLPATAVPLASSENGLPLGGQVVGPFHGDHATLHVAALLERYWRGFVAPPAWG